MLLLPNQAASVCSDRDPARGRRIAVRGSRLWSFCSPVLVLSSFTVACGQAVVERAAGVYAHDIRALVRLDYDYDGDGRIDVRTYMRDGRPVRLEGDGNGDGVIDRWEYYGRNGDLLRIGGSTQRDGREDTWVHTRGDERYVDIASSGDGVIDRREVYRGDALVRAESDTNHDGRADRWEEFRDGALVRLLVDEQRSGRATRRITYEGQDSARIETDLDGDGNWEAAGAAR
jgi:hypothetical protein